MVTLRRTLSHLVLAGALAWAAAASFCEGPDSLLVPIVDRTPPTVAILAAAGVADRVVVEVSAQDGTALRTLTVEVNTLGAAGDTVRLASRIFEFLEPVKDTTLIVAFNGLVLAPGQPLVIGAQAEDGSRNVAVAFFRTVVGLLTVDVLEPADSASVSVGDSVLVAAFLGDPAGIVSLTLVGRALRGSPELGTDSAVIRYAPKTITFDPPARDTVIRRFLRPTADRTQEAVQFVALAESSAGRIVADSNLAFVVLAPRVAIISPSPGQSILTGGVLDVRLRVTDSTRVVSVGLSGSGAVSFDTAVSFRVPVVDTTVSFPRAIPAGASGALTLSARATNTNGALGRSGALTVNVTTAAAADGVRPRLSYIFDNVPRLEIDDSIRVLVTAEDAQSGIRTVGLSVASDNGGVKDTAVFRTEFGIPRTGTVIQEFFFVPFNVEGARLDTVVYEFQAFAYDGAAVRNCAAAASAGPTQSLVCDSLLVGGVRVVLARNATGTRYQPTIVSGRTMPSPRQGSVTPDVVVDTTRRLLFVSNKTFNQVEVFNLATRAFERSVAVGAEPWGMTIDNSGDTLIVANSAGTNLSKVAIGTLREVTSKRIFTPNALLFEAAEEQSETGAVIRVTPFDFSDRPQFVAQAANVGAARGVLLYSTVPTPSAPNGTIREFDTQTGDVRFFIKYANTLPTVDLKRIQIVNADSVVSTGSLLFVCDHDRGSPMSACFRAAGVTEALDSLANHPLWDTEIFSNLDIASIGLRDTTFLAPSGDRRFIAFGEGATGDAPGRIMMYQASDSSISSKIEVRDLIGNAAEPVRGLALNRDGSLGVARGAQVYFFDQMLRLQGKSAEVATAGIGAAFHPDYANATLASDLTQLAFLGSSGGRIDIIDAFHFCRRGSLFIRDSITGPVRTSRRLLGDPAGVLVKVYALTSAGVVVVDVMPSDVSPSCQP